MFLLSPLFSLLCAFYASPLSIIREVGSLLLFYVFDVAWTLGNGSTNFEQESKKVKEMGLQYLRNQASPDLLIGKRRKRN